MTERTAIVAALIVIVVLSVLDVITTDAAMRAGAVEGNPLARWLMDRGALLTVKLAVCIVLAWIAYRARLRDAVFTASVTWFVGGVYAATVVSNSAGGA